ncbi:MAG TPA: N-acetyltransferase [Acidobacteriaceae bacterium]|nr:N-acetyltransferase [Acidobacteriaceae bacterium]
MPLTIRPAVSQDFPALYALDQACFAPGIAWSEAELHYFLRYPGNIALVAEEHSRIAGFAIAGSQKRGGVLVGRLITIDVDSSMRRRGIGHRLLQTLEDRLRAQKAVAVLLEVAVDNLSAQEFYVRHGFVRTGRIPGYYMDRIDALVMEKPLAS